ncbi:hypothetical protein [Staphylococcus edaphicus]|uniref:Uncharacterized protein n=1 Tax=Staphylococcus edaphicus TaxID=1955013 RepID=A0A2C6WTJ5_9STAP|nr:hypothetical protein [Staphylococcus edaphicus]PHK50777.1 hypothetical protein BTJ66_00290 [Staphylococcus edaphicus]UQW82471.1 hypothetical protein MNY58_05250 [Staphylococcus edaphicus]
MGFFIFKFIIMLMVLGSIGCLGIIMKWAWESKRMKHDKGILSKDGTIAIAFGVSAAAIPFVLLFTYKIIEMTFTF